MRISDWSSDVCSSDLGRSEWPRRPIPRGAVANSRRADQQRTFYAIVRSFREVERGPRSEGNCIRGRGGLRRLKLFRHRSEESREGKEWVSTCRSRWSQYHKKQNKRQK